MRGDVFQGEGGILKWVRVILKGSEKMHAEFSRHEGTFAPVTIN